MFFTRLSTLTCAAIVCAPMALAHEFWIEPLEFQVENDQPVVADLRNGQLFDGTRLPFMASSNTYFEAVFGVTRIPVTGRMGDRPAITLPPLGADGLLILAHEAAASDLTYKEWEKFLKFATHKDFTDAADIHTARGWPMENFKETYTRHSKALIAVGNGEGADQDLGLWTEFVARDNPYAADFDGTLDVSLLFDSKPRADAQIEVYARDAQGVVTVTITRTDVQGNAAIPVQAGFDYMLDAVVLSPASDAEIPEGMPVWETYWASLTFAVPLR
jgi:uncharacterized GH25 family protein